MTLQAKSPIVFLSIRGLTKLFSQGDVQAGVRDLNLDIEAGEGFALLGPSGCGKTTTLRILGGFETPDSGQITLKGQDLLKTPANKRPIRTVFQKYALFPHLSVYENIVFSLRMNRVEENQLKKSAEEVIELVQVRHLLGRPVSKLSGGEQQRVALARALISQPEILLMDEPLSALDLKLRERMQLELLRLRKQIGSTFVFVTHDQTEAMVLSDRIGVMNQGHIQQVGTPSEIYFKPVNKFVATFIGMANFLGNEQASLIEGATQLLPEKRSQDSWMLRPESLQIRKMGSSIENPWLRFKARIVDSAFLGQDWLTKVCDQTGQQHLVKTPGYEKAPGQEGEEIWVCWEAEDICSVQSV